MTTSDAPFYRPYKEESRDFLYNLMFCDGRDIFRPKDGTPTGPLAAILKEPLQAGDLRTISEDPEEESRYRALAFNRLRLKGAFVPGKLILGAIVEVVLPEGLDTLAAYADGRVRYLNHAGAPAIFEGAPKQVAEKAVELIQVSQPIVDHSKPTEQPRRAPPEAGHARLSFVGSDGLYFREAEFGKLASDPATGPVIKCAGELLMLVVDAVMKK